MPFYIFLPSSNFPGIRCEGTSTFHPNSCQLQQPSRCSVKTLSSRSCSAFTRSSFKVLLGPSAMGLTHPTKCFTSSCQADCGATSPSWPCVKSLANSHGSSASAELWQRSSKVVNLFRNFLDSWWSCFSTTIRAISSASVASTQSRQPSDLSFTQCSCKASWASRDRRLRGDSQWVCLKTGYNLYKNYF